jgi:uncharacterized protein
MPQNALPPEKRADSRWSNFSLIVKWSVPFYDATYNGQVDLPRLYDAVLDRHLREERQMAFVAGPRQVGKTTTCRAVRPGADYLSWDDLDDRRLIAAGPAAAAARLRISELAGEKRVVVFDELHKYRKWKTFLKGLFDKHAAHLSIIVTGSARLDVYRRGGDSLMGRYFLYHMHPLSIGELVRPGREAGLLAEPVALDEAARSKLWLHGGFPEPYLRGDSRFTTRWRALRRQQLVREDLRDLTRIQELDQLALLVDVLERHSSAQVSYTALAQQVSVSVDTIRRWLTTLTSLHHGFLVRPWYRNVKKSLRKEPKYYLRDWSGIVEPGPRAETYVACHLFKAVQVWQDLGFGEFGLCYLRDKQRREVDFVVIRDGQPWFLVEVKQAQRELGPNLRYFQLQLAAPHAFQIVLDMPFVQADPFERSEPTVVPASTLLSQLP